MEPQDESHPAETSNGGSDPQPELDRSPSSAQLVQNVSIISVDELAKLLQQQKEGQSKVVQVVDARPRPKYRSGHIPGSIHMVWEEWSLSSPRRVWNKLMGKAKLFGRVLDGSAIAYLQTRLNRLGLFHDIPIVVVGEPNLWGEEGRIAWNLLFWGASNVSLLDGGHAAWENAGMEVARRGALLNRPGQGTFQVHIQRDRRALIDDVQELTHDDSDHALFDVRDFEEFQGSKLMPHQRRAGHIPTAIHLSISNLYQADGTYVDKEELEQLLSKAKCDGNDIAYCTGGIRSALLAVLSEARMGSRMKNYDASIWEWASMPEYPMKKGAISARHIQQ